MSSFIVKFEHGSDMRRRSFAGPVDWHILVREMETMFPALQGQQILCTYLDEDKDRITIAGEGDYEELLRQQLPVVKLTIAVKASRAAAVTARSSVDDGRKVVDVEKKTEKLKAMLEKGNVKRANNFIAKVARNLGKQSGNPSLSEFLTATLAKLADADKKSLLEVAKIAEASVRQALSTLPLAFDTEEAATRQAAAITVQPDTAPRANDVVLRSKLRKAVAEGQLNGALVMAGQRRVVAGALTLEASPGENVSPVWQLMNTGALPWGPSVVLRQLPPATPAAAPLGPVTFPVVARSGTACVAPGEKLTVSLPITAPRVEGTHEAVYTLQALPKAGPPLWFGPRLRLALTVRTPVRGGAGERGASEGSERAGVAATSAPPPGDAAACDTADVDEERGKGVVRGEGEPCPAHGVICLPYHPLAAHKGEPSPSSWTHGIPSAGGDEALRVRLRTAVRAGELDAVCAVRASARVELSASPLQQVQPAFTLVNSGSLPWSAALVLRRVAGEMGPALVGELLPRSTACLVPGEQLTVSIPITAPRAEGKHEAVYTLQALPKAGPLLQFGPQLRVCVAVARTDGVKDAGAVQPRDLRTEEVPPTADWVEVPEPEGARSSTATEAEPPPPCSSAAEVQPVYPSTATPGVPAGSPAMGAAASAPTVGSVEGFLRALVAECQGAVEPEGVSGALLSQRVKSLLLDMYQQSRNQATTRP